MHPTMRMGIKAGAAGIIVPNGGRNLDTVPATIDALPAVVDKVAGRVPVIVDGGIRRGTDVLKALGYGASAVMIGRPYLHGLAVNGAAGVEARDFYPAARVGECNGALRWPTIASLDRSIFFGSFEARYQFHTGSQGAQGHSTSSRCRMISNRGTFRFELQKQMQLLARCVPAARACHGAPVLSVALCEIDEAPT